MIAQQNTGRRRNIRDILQKYPSEKYHLLYPGQSDMEIDELFEVVAEEVSIDPEPENQEVFDAGSFKDSEDKWQKKLALTQTALQKLAYTAGIVSDPSQSHRVETGDPLIVTWQVHAGLQKPDGTPLRAIKTKTIDLHLQREKMEASLKEKAKKGYIKKGWGSNEKVLKDGTPECEEEMKRQLEEFMFKQRQDAPQKAESGAMSRCIRALLGLKPFYVHNQLSKPFVVIKVVLNTAMLMMDKQSRQMLIANAVASRTNMFGANALPPASEQRMMMLAEAPAEVIKDTPDDAKDEVDQPDTSPATEPKKTEEPSKTQDEIDKENRENWMNAPAPQRVKEIKRLVKAKGYVAKDERLKKPEGLNDKQQVDFIMHLYSLPDQSEDAPLNL